MASAGSAPLFAARMSNSRHIQQSQVQKAQSTPSLFPSERDDDGDALQSPFIHTASLDSCRASGPLLHNLEELTLVCRHRRVLTPVELQS